MSDRHSRFHNRRSIRLKGYDYSRAGLYFITLCVQNRERLFGEIRPAESSVILSVESSVDATVEAVPVEVALVATSNPAPAMILNDAGRMIESEWLALKNRFPHIELHEFVVMPNHFHGILEIVDEGEGATTRVAPTEIAPTEITMTEIVPKRKTIGDMMDAFKSITTVEYIRGVRNHGWKRFDGKLWQRDYWEHIIRDDGSLERIAKYILRNPDKWAEDRLTS